MWVVYRVSDAALLLAAIVLHLHGEGDFDKLLGDLAWPEGRAAVAGGCVGHPPALGHSDG